MPRLKDLGINDRARDIYRWCLENPSDRFIARDVAGYAATPTNTSAMRLLLNRDLIKEVNCNARPRVYGINRVVPIEGCLDVLPIDQNAPVTRYRVAPSVAGEYAMSRDLQKYAIG